jgi:hypothetical protein
LGTQHAKHVGLRQPGAGSPDPAEIFRFLALKQDGDERRSHRQRLEGRAHLREKDPPRTQGLAAAAFLGVGPCEMLDDFKDAVSV